MALSPQLILPTVLTKWMEENALESDLFTEGPKRGTIDRLDELGLDSASTLRQPRLKVDCILIL